MIKKIIDYLAAQVSEKILREQEVEKADAKMLLAKTIMNQIDYDKIDFNDSEFKIFSQWGDDGLIQYVINKIPELNKSFVEFGVENYVEANTRFVLMNDNWRGLVIDGDEGNVSYIKNDSIYWKYNLVAKQAFVTAENINLLLSESGFEGEIGLLHIDIDGNDYWVWKAITAVRPQVVIVEYNSMFGSDRAITIPYKPDFVRSREHYSYLYAGASLPALIHLAHEKGYFFIGSNSAGNNAYFIKDDLRQFFTEVTLEQGYRVSQFRECRNEEGNLTFESREESIERLKGLLVYNTKTEQNEEF